MLVLRFDRDSVSAGDDSVDHRYQIIAPGSSTLAELLADKAPGVSFEGGGSGRWTLSVVCGTGVGRRRVSVGVYDEDCGGAQVVWWGARTLAELDAEGEPVVCFESGIGIGFRSTQEALAAIARGETR